MLSCVGDVFPIGPCVPFSSGCPEETIVGNIGIFGDGMRLRAPVGFLAVALLVAGYAGARCMIWADRLRYPASLSLVLPDGQGRLLDLDEKLRSVGAFSFDRTPDGYPCGEEPGVGVAGRQGARYLPGPPCDRPEM